MKTKILFSLLATCLLLIGSSSQIAYAAETIPPATSFTSNGRSYPIYGNTSPQAFYYNGKTYVAWQGTDFDPYIDYFDHNAKTWHGAVKVGTNQLGTDWHGAPALWVDNNGYIHVVFGAHCWRGEGMQYCKSNNPENIDAWTAQTSLADNPTYPMVTKLPDGTVYIFFRNSYGDDDGDLRYIKSTDWSTEYTIVEVDVNGEDAIYCSNAEYDATNSRIHLVWTHRDDSNPVYDQNKINLYHAYLELSDGHMYTIEGTDLGTTISFSEANTYCKIVDYTAYNGMDYSSRVRLDSNNYPHVVYGKCINEASRISVFYKYWTGSSWSPEHTICTNTNVSWCRDFNITTISDIDCYVPRLDKGLEKYHWNGSSWSLSSTIMPSSAFKSEGTLSGQLVEGWQSELKYIFADYAHISKETPLDVFALDSDDGIVAPRGQEPPGNNAPVLNPIGNKTISQGNLLQFTISAIDPDGDHLYYSVLNLPEDASFEPNTRVFSWTPAESQIGLYSDIRFLVNDGNLSDSEHITINVISNSPSPTPSDTPVPSGGGGPREAPAGTIYVADYVGTSGVFIKDIIVESADTNVKLRIRKGIKGKTKQSEPLFEIKINELEETLPENSGIIGLVYDIKPDGATFDQPISITIAYDPSAVPAGVDEEDLAIVYWDDDTNQWITLESISIDNQNNNITAQISHFSIYSIAANASPAAFELTSLSITPCESEIGEEVTISAQVKNIGGQAGNYCALLKINNIVQATNEVIVEPGNIQEIRFCQSKNMAGTYNVEINGLTGSFILREPQIINNEKLNATSLDEELDVNNNSIVSAENSEITSQSTAPHYSLAILGEMISISLFFSLIMTLVILIRRRRLIKRYT